MGIYLLLTPLKSYSEFKFESGKRASFTVSVWKSGQEKTPSNCAKRNKTFFNLKGILFNS
jgi:hypothetical protein